MLQAEHITVRYGQHTVVDDVSFSLEKGQWLMLAGPNGAGKSTLIRAIARSVKSTGRITLMGKDVRRYSPHEMARRVGVLAQHNHVGYGYTVEEIVDLGRYAHARDFLSGRDQDGEQQVEHALRAAGLQALRHKSVLALSGGELQRVFLAQVFAQNPDILLLDEPANHLDLAYQKHIFSLIGEWLAGGDRAVLSVAHDLSLARRYGTHAALMHHGKCVAIGRTHAVFTPENLQAVYEMDVHGWMKDMLGQWTLG